MRVRRRLAAIAAGVVAIIVMALLTLQYTELQEASRRVTLTIVEADDVPPGATVANITEDHLSRLPPRVADGFRTAADLGFAHVVGLSREEVAQAYDVLGTSSFEGQDAGPLYRYGDRVLRTSVAV